MIKKMFLGVLALGLMATSCSDDDDNASSTSVLNVNLSGLESLGNDFVYEGWIIVDGAPVSTGVFTVDAMGNLSETSFSADATQLANATSFVLSIEPAVDPDPAPAATKILAGDFSGNSASVHSDNIVIASESTLTSMDDSIGNYILATPTDNDMTNEYSGVWLSLIHI